MKQHLIDFYLDWVNNFVSTEGIASYYGLEVSHVESLIAMGKVYHEQTVFIRTVTK